MASLNEPGYASAPSHHRGSESDLGREMYYGENYLDWTQWSSQTRQVLEIAKFKPTSLIEIGPGNKVVSTFFERGGVRVDTVDVNDDLGPSIVASVLELDQHVKPKSYDVAACCEVLEHLPFKDFDKAVEQLAKTCTKGALITLPIARYVLLDFQMRIKTARGKPVDAGFVWSLPRGQNRIFKGHYWEINSAKWCSLKEVRKVISKHFYIVRDYRERWHSYHRFFILEPKSPAV